MITIHFYIQYPPAILMGNNTVSKKDERNYEMSNQVFTRRKEKQKQH